MKKNNTIKILFFLAISLSVVSCKKKKLENTDSIEWNAPFGAVFFAQTHVFQPEHRWSKFISNRDALIKINLKEGHERALKKVTVTVELNGSSEELEIQEPTEKEEIDRHLGKLEHKFENSYTSLIDKKWIQPGLIVEIKVGGEKVTYPSLEIGAPNRLVLTMFDVSFFEPVSGDYAPGWLEELKMKLPVSDIELIRVPNILFREVTIPPRKSVLAPSARVASKADYKTLTGANFDGEQAAMTAVVTALKVAGGFANSYSLNYVNIYGVPGGGEAGGFKGVGNGTATGILLHELGHALGVKHIGNYKTYPWVGDMYGIPKPEVFKDVHVGPTWAFDSDRMQFIPPTVQQENGIGGAPGTYKKDPMQGGGTGDQEKGFLFRHFSDWSTHHIMKGFLASACTYNDGNGNNYKWSDATGSFSDLLPNNGVQHSVIQNTQVISIIAGTSFNTAQANIVYPPIGPYKGGLIDLFDPSVESDRARASEVYCPNGGCDYSLKIVQGGTTKTLMIPIAEFAEDPVGSPELQKADFACRGVNISAEDGVVSSVELLATPNAEIDGLPDTPAVLYTWTE